MVPKGSKNLKKVCWVVPVHPPHFDLYLRHLKIAYKLVRGVSHVAVFTTRAEADAFLGLESSVRPERLVVLEDFFSRESLDLFLLTKSIINVKKLFAVKHLQHSYSHLIVTDCEVEVVAPLSIEDIVSHRTFFPFHRVTKSHLLQKVAAPAAMIVAEDDRNWVMKNLVDRGLYSWFSDLPIYESLRLEGFWERFSLLDNDDFLRLTYDTFDYILYQYHLVLSSRGSGEEIWEEVKSDFESAIGSAWEIGNQTQAGHRFLEEASKRHQPLWVSNLDFLGLFPTAKVLFHTDRVVLAGKASTREKILRIIVLASRRLLRL
jgi:hypothetical protein